MKKIKKGLVMIMAMTVLATSNVAGAELDFTDGSDPYVVDEKSEFWDFSDGSDETILEDPELGMPSDVEFGGTEEKEGWLYTQYLQDGDSANKAIADAILEFEGSAYTEPHIGTSITCTESKSCYIYKCTAMREQLEVVYHKIDNTVAVYRTWLKVFPK